MGSAGLAERAEVWAAVCALPPRMRATLVLRYYEDLAEAEVAAVLDCSVGSVQEPDPPRPQAAPRPRWAAPGRCFLEETR